MAWPKGIPTWNKGKKQLQTSGEKNPNWIGGLPNCKDCNKKLSRYHPKTNQCQKCFSTDPTNIEIAKTRLVGIDNHGGKSPRWKGKNVRYSGLHMWINRNYGKAQECVYCGKTKDEGKLEWANVSGEYKRDLSDFMSLCVPCHKKYDLNSQEGGRIYGSA